MIKPQTEADLQDNILVMSADIIEQLKDSYKGYVMAEDLLRKFLSKRNRTPEKFLKCLTFLYTIGYIEEKNYKIRLTEEAKNGFVKESSLSDFTN